MLYCKIQAFQLEETQKEKDMQISAGHKTVWATNLL